VSAFDRLHPAVQHHVVNSLGWRGLRDVQELAIDGVLDGQNLVVLAPTAGGKTEAAFLPLLSRTLSEEWAGLSVLYLSPIRALLNNQEPRLGRYYELVGRRVGVWHGDTPSGQRQRLLAAPPDCLLTTPESLEVMLISRLVPHREFLDRLQAVVIDEAHAFAGDDRGWHLLALLSRISRLARRDLQRIGLSATVGNPEALAEWLSAGSRRSRRVIRPLPREEAPPRVELDYVGNLRNAAKVIHELHRGEKRLVFLDSRSRVEELAAALRGLGTRTYVSHSSLGLEERRQAEQAFAEGDDCVIVATSALELGMDVGDLDRVVQVDAPGTVSSFLQRMGRTGRRPGAERNCLFLATSDDALLRAAALIELWAEGYMEEVEPPPEPLHILAQQLMALALQEGGIGRSEWLEWIREVPAFARLPETTAGEVVDWMLDREILWDDGGILWLGKKGEEEYGRRNFLELFAVFSAPPLFTVLHGREELGYVHQMSFLARQEGPVVLLLAGRSWQVRHLDWKRRIAHVEPSEEKGRTRWSGGGQMLSYTLAQAMARVLAGSEMRPEWSRRARAEMEAQREAFPWLEVGKTTIVSFPQGRLEWWTFGGGKANAALGVSLERATGVPAAANSLSLRFKGELQLEKLMRAIEDARTLGPAALRPPVSEEALEGLKFRSCLPQEMARGELAARLAEPAAVEGVLRQQLNAVRVP
jgi:ATP-dependent Lhr-like helicase